MLHVWRPRSRVQTASESFPQSDELSTRPFFSKLTTTLHALFQRSKAKSKSLCRRTPEPCACTRDLMKYWVPEKPREGSFRVQIKIELDGSSLRVDRLLVEVRVRLPPHARLWPMHLPAWRICFCVGAFSNHFPLFFSACGREDTKSSYFDVFFLLFFQ